MSPQLEDEYSIDGDTVGKTLKKEYKSHVLQKKSNIVDGLIYIDCPPLFFGKTIKEIEFVPRHQMHHRRWFEVKYSYEFATVNRPHRGKHLTFLMF